MSFLDVKERREEEKKQKRKDVEKKKQERNFFQTSYSSLPMVSSFTVATSFSPSVSLGSAFRIAVSLVSIVLPKERPTKEIEA